MKLKMATMTVTTAFTIAMITPDEREEEKKNPCISACRLHRRSGKRGRTSNGGDDAVDGTANSREYGALFNPISDVQISPDTLR